MPFPGIFRRIFENKGAGPKLRSDILPLNYGACSTAAGTAAKVVSLPGFVLATGAEVTVRFTVTNTASSPTLNINGTGAKPIQYRNAAISAGDLAANRVYKFVYDGGAWELVGDINIDTNTTYAAATTSNLGLVKVGTNISVSEGTISVANGSTSAKGVVQLSSATNSTSTTLAATSSAVKAAYDKGISAASAASKAQTAADAAQSAADDALSAAQSSGKVTKRGERATNGDWTLTGLTVGKPVYLLFVTSAKLPVGVIRFHAKDGSIESLYNGAGGAVFGLGNDNQSQVMGNVAVFIPTSITLTIWISLSSGAQKAIAYQ